MTSEQDSKEDEIARLNAQSARLESGGALLQSLSDIQRFRRIMKERPGDCIKITIGSGVAGIGGCMQLELNDHASVHAALDTEERSDMAELKSLGIQFGAWS